MRAFLSKKSLMAEMEEESLIDFGELAQDENFKRRILGLKRDLRRASKMVHKVLEEFEYEELSAEDKVRYDLFLAFAINSYFWMYLRLKGIDTSQHDIKGQINRIRDYMKKSKQIYEKQTRMPKVDQGAARRFVDSGLWTPKKSVKGDSTSKSPPCKCKHPPKDKN